MLSPHLHWLFPAPECSPPMGVPAPSQLQRREPHLLEDVLLIEESAVLWRETQSGSRSPSRSEPPGRSPA